MALTGRRVAAPVIVVLAVLVATWVTARASGGLTSRDGASRAQTADTRQVPSPTSSAAPDPILMDKPSVTPGDDAPGSGGGAAPPQLDSGHWSLVFSDDFPGDSLDNAKWGTSFPWGPTAHWTPDVQYQASNVAVQGGRVHLLALRETAEGKLFTSGMLCSADKFAFKYGFVEARLMIPAGRGLWPAFWLLPSSGAWPPEIDVMENLGSSPKVQHMHYHYVDDSGATRDSAASWSGPDLSTNFHTYGLQWSPSAIRWFVDGVERRAAYTDASTIASEPMYLIANIQVGGAWPGNPDERTAFPADLQIDYIRVWRTDSAS